MNMLTVDEVSGDTRHASPGIVGRLMGLDTMPSFGVYSHSTYTGIRSQNISPEGSCDKHGFSEDVPHRRNTKFKDVFEVMEAAKMKTENHKSKRTDIYSELDKVKKADINFVRQKFMNAKHLSTDESFQRPKEFDDALEALVSNKDLLLEFLQESSIAPTKDSPDLSCSPFSSVNRITVLKPCRTSKFIDADIYPPEGDTKKCYRALKEAKHSTRKPCANHYSQPPKEDIGSFRQKVSRSSYQEGIDTHISPTRIVVLKPCLNKTENMEGAFPLTLEMFPSSYRKPKAPLDDGNGTRSASTEECMCQMSTREPNVLGRGGKVSMEIARKVTKKLRRAIKGGVGENQIPSPDLEAFSWDMQASSLSPMAKLKSSEPYNKSKSRHDASDAPNSSYSPAYITKTSIRKEAKRRISDRWKMTHQYQHPSKEAYSFSTLGDMLALSDKEVPKITSGSPACRKCPKGELHSNGMPGSGGYPLGISSSDGWKDESICSSDELGHGRPMSLLVRSSTHHCDKVYVPSLDGDESMIAEREIHVNFEGPACSVAVPDSPENGFVQPANSNHNFSAQCNLDRSYAVPEWQYENLLMHQEPTCVLDDHLIYRSPGNSSKQVQAEEHVLNQFEGNTFTSNPLEESVPLMSPLEDDQPSSVSVLESSLDSEDGCSGGFEKISAHLQELRMQLRLLKMEATDDADGTDLVLSSDDEISARFKPLCETAQTSDTFQDAYERDFSYVLDILTCLGIQCDEQLNACYLGECPASSDVYDSLEKKYGKLILWPGPERRLLFDLTNDAVMDVIISLTHFGSQGMLKKCQFKWDKEGVLEEVWGRVCRQRQEAECFQEERLMGVGWFDCEDVTNQIVGELGNMLDEELLEEMAADLLL